MKTTPKPSPITQTPPSIRRWTVLYSLVMALLVAGAILAAFLPALSGDFLNWDDDRNFLRNDSFRGFGATQLRWAWQTYHLGVWQPLAWTLLGAQAGEAELDPRIFHATSLGLHFFNCLLLYSITVRIVWSSLSTQPPGRMPPASASIDSCACIGAGLATLLFAVHPLRVEPVVWISCQPYLPAVLFYLLAVHAYLSAARRWQATGGYGWWPLPCLVTFLLALGCKAVAVSLPAVLLIIDVWVLNRRANAVRRSSWVRLILEKLPLAAVAVPVCVWAMAAKEYNASRVPWDASDLGTRLAQSAYGLVFYLLRTLVPIDLSPYYRLPSDVRLSAWPYVACALFIPLLTIILWLMRRRRPGLIAAWLAYVVILLPNLGIVQISQQLAADRYAYLAMMPIMIVLGGVLARIWQRAGSFRLARIGIAALVLALAAGEWFATRSYAACWTTSDALWRRVLKLDPACAVAHCNLGEDLLRREDYSEASTHLSRAIELEPGFSFAYANFAALLVRADRPEHAVAACEQALAAQPPLTGLDLARTHAILGEAYAAQRKDDLAWKHTLIAKRMGFSEADKMIAYLRQFSKEPE